MSMDSVSSGVGLVGSLFGAGSSAKQAKKQAELDNKAAAMNADIEEKNAAFYDLMAENSLLRGKKEAGDFRRSIDQLKGQQRAAYGGSGVVVDEGSARDVVVDTAKWGEYDAQTLLYNSQVEALGQKQQAQNSRDSAEMLRATKRSPSLAAGGAFLNGVPSIASSFSSFTNTFKKAPAAAKQGS